MRFRYSIFLLVFLLHVTVQAQNHKQDSAHLKRISNYILNNYACYTDLEYLCKQIGHRLTASPQAAQAVDWGKKTFEAFGCDKVYLQEVMVPHWERGEAEAYISHLGKRMPMPILSLGNAIGTGIAGIEATVLKINHIDELKAMSAAQVRGKIVFYNFRFDQTNINTFESYGPCVYYRWGAPSEAAKLGAVGVVIRSVSSAFDDKPHTGTVSYSKDAPQIPAVAISNIHADRLEAMCNSSKTQPTMYMRTTCAMLQDVVSYNVIAELTGTEKPKEIICFGGHLDSWDVGEGAHDDGAGVVQTIDVLRTFKKLGIRPRHTLRAILFMNEENGLRGAKKYAEWVEERKEKHILALESDAGGATPHGFSMIATPAQREKIKTWLPLLLPYGLYSFDREGGGADINPLNKKFGTPVLELMPDSQRYFDMHHSANDVFENVHRRELCLGAIAMTQLLYLVDRYGME